MTSVGAWLDRLDDLSGGRFFVTLYLVRWPVVIPLSYVQGYLAHLMGAPEGGGFPIPAAMVALAGWLVIAPLLETSIECALPYAILNRIRALDTPRPWRFVVVSGIVMAVLHLPYAAPLGFVTGAFLAYCYAHFAISSRIAAFVYTCVYHACINAVGWVGVFVVGWR